MYPHQAERLDGALARLGVHAIVAASTANVAYVSGFRSLSRELSPASFAIYARTGTALVIPAIDAAAVTTGDVHADHVVCHGRCPVHVGTRADDAARRAAEEAAAAAAHASQEAPATIPFPTSPTVGG